MTSTAAAAARRAAAAMDVVIVVVAFLTMAFSLGNIHQFALEHGTADPIAWFLAPAVDLALIGALTGDAFLSRHGLTAGPWAARLRWFAGAATLALNVWESVAVKDAAGIVLHAVPPILLFVLAEAAVPYRRQFAAAVDRAKVDTRTAPAVDHVSTPVDVDTAPASTPPAEHTAPVPSQQVGSVDPPAVDPVSTNEAEPAEVDTPEPARLATEVARKVIEAGWREGRSARAVAVDATRHPSYVARVYRELEAEHGDPATPLSLVK